MKYLLGRKSDNRVFIGRGWIIPTDNLKAELQDIKYIKVKGVNAYEIME